MIKYTGFGNAAGMFASRGLLNEVNPDYSSDSENSETEEYKEVKDQYVSEFSTSKFINAFQ